MITSFTVDRSRWLRGERNSFLQRTTDGKRCCLGFLALACGVPESGIVGWELLSRLEHQHFALLPEALKRNTAARGKQVLLVDRLMELNDDYIGYGFSKLSSEAERELELAEAFREAGIEVTFTDGAE